MFSSLLANEAVSLSIGRPEVLGPNKWVAFGLAVLVGVGVFALIWKIRKTFGMKE